MKNIADLTEDERQQYMKLLGEATDSVVPPDARWVLCLFDDAGMAHYVSSGDRRDMPDALRALADRLESDITRGN